MAAHSVSFARIAVPGFVIRAFTKWSEFKSIQSPDPSLVYIDGTYFLINSSFHLYPGLPIYASGDLKEWKHIGNALNRPTQRLSLQRSVTTIVDIGLPDENICDEGGLCAPTIRYHKGTFFIVCTNVIHTNSQLPSECERQNFILTTTDIWADEWSDPMSINFDAIDTSLFWDDDDRVYLIGAASSPPNTSIRQIEIDVETGKKLSEEKLLWEGITNVYPEGPHMYKKDGWYYLLIAEGGCFADHHTIMTRSQDIWGPYEANPLNPVLAKANPDGYINYTSHGDLFHGPMGQWYFVCLGVRKKNGRFVMGRESVLTIAAWPQGEYPVINPVELDVPLIAKSNPVLDGPIEKKTERPRVSYVRIRDPVEENYEYEGNSFTLTASQADMSNLDVLVTFIGKRQRSLDGSASATLDKLDLSATSGSRLRTGLCYYKDEHWSVCIYLDVGSGKIALEIVNKARYLERSTIRSVAAPEKSAKISFGIDYTELEFTFWFSVYNATTKIELGRVDTLDMTGHDFVSTIIGMYTASDKAVKVRYSEFVMENM